MMSDQKTIPIEIDPPEGWRFVGIRRIVPGQRVWVLSGKGEPQSYATNFSEFVGVVIERVDPKTVTYEEVVPRPKALDSEERHFETCEKGGMYEVAVDSTYARSWGPIFRIKKQDPKESQES